MTDCYYVYTDEQLREALADHFRDHVRSGRLDREEAERLRHVILRFHQSEAMALHGMRRHASATPEQDTNV